MARSTFTTGLLRTRYFCRVRLSWLGSGTIRPARMKSSFIWCWMAVDQENNPCSCCLEYCHRSRSIVKGPSARAQRPSRSGRKGRHHAHVSVSREAGPRHLIRRQYPIPCHCQISWRWLDISIPLLILYSFRSTRGSVLLGRYRGAAKSFCRGRDASVVRGGDPRRTAARFPDPNISVRMLERPNARLPKVYGRRSGRANCEARRDRLDRPVSGRTWICEPPFNSAGSFPNEPQPLRQMHTGND
jgi:hypothetical protein